ncbi:MAG: hypothetical protein L6R45_02540 [Anaerolineae bacterium]|nr:hypothetical protein [Anaerolineae bacterium]
MTDQNIILAGLALLSLALPVGWAWWQKRQGEAGINEQWLSVTARFIYGIGLPYLAVIAGLLPPRFLGLKGLETIMALDLNGASLQKAVALLLLECLADGGMVIRLGLAALLLALGLRWGLARLDLKPLASRLSVLEILYDGLHWAFYYAIFWALTGDLYLGVIGGLLWVLLEGALVAWVQRDEPTPRLSKTVILILTATIFFYAPNLWLLWPVHGGLAFIGTRRETGPG